MGSVSVHDKCSSYNLSEHEDIQEAFMNLLMSFLLLILRDAVSTFTWPGVRLGQVRSGQVRVRLGQIRSGQVRSG